MQKGVMLMPRGVYDRNESWRAKQARIQAERHRKAPRDIDRFKTLIHGVLQDPEPPADLYHTYNAFDYEDTGARLVKKDEFAALSGPCVVIKPGEKHKKSPPG